jgi:ATP-dependent DNA helicase RecG
VIVPISDLLQQINSVGEDQRIEAKTAEQMGPSILETICAFANEPGLGGGYLLLGVTRYESPARSEDEYVVVGVPDADALQADLASQCASTFNQPIRPLIWAEDIDGKHVIGVFVSEAQPQEKPIHFRSQGLPRGAFRRIGTTDQRCSEDDMIVFYQDQRYGTYDETVVPDADLSDLEPEAIAAYRRFREEVDPQAEELRWSDEDLLYSLGCASKERGRLVPTIAGLLLFGNQRALRRYFPMMRVDYIRVPGREWVSNPDRRFDTIELRGPLIQLISRIHTTILSDLPKAFALPIGRVQRLDIPAIPDRVIREVVVNAVMHRSYRIHGAVQIIRYANRLEIRNPGHSLIAEDQLGEPGSKTRNPKIAAVLHETRFAETKGSGIRVMREMMTEANLSPPTFESNRGRDEFVATLLMHHFLDSEDMAWLAGFQHYQISDDEAKAFVFVRETGAIANGPYRDLNQVDPRDARRHLRHLCDLGLLEQKGKGFETYYVGTPALFQLGASGSVGVGATKSAAKHGQLPLPDVQSSGLPPESSGLVAESSGLPALPDDLAQAVTALGSRSSYSAVRPVIRQLCAWRPLSPAEIARLLGRTQNYIRQHYLRPMVRDGELAYTIPDKPAHPHQAYRAVEKEER